MEEGALRHLWLVNCRFLPRDVNLQWQARLHLQYTSSLFPAYFVLVPSHTHHLRPALGTTSAAMSAALTTNVDQRLLRTTKFPPEFNAKVDLKKVNVQLIKAWVGDEIARILKSEDDVVVELVNNILDSARHVRQTLQISTCSIGHAMLIVWCSRISRNCKSSLRASSRKMLRHSARHYGSCA